MNADSVQEQIAEITVGIDLLRSGYEVQWAGGEVVDGVINMRWPDYDKGLWSALTTAYSAIGPDYKYLENFRDIEHLEVPELNREQLSTWLTWVLRGERFNDGFVEQRVIDGRLLSALERSVALLAGD